MEKECKKCGKVKKFILFHKNIKNKDGISEFCRGCSTIISKKESSKENKNIKKLMSKIKTKKAKKHPGLKTSPEYIRSQRLLTVYGLTLDDYNEYLEAQLGRCAICKRKEKDIKGNLVVDHNHGTGHVRGLLCHTCNVGIGFLKDDISILSSAIKYLNYHN